MSKILVIEDESGVRDSIVDILNAEDFIVDSAPNGEDGLRLIQEFHPDLVLCDIMMPVLDGYGVLEQVRQDAATKTLPFIFLTAKAERVDFRRGMDLGADDYLTKPFTHNDLLSMIRTRLGAKHDVDEQAQQQLNALRTSLNTALPRELGLPLKEVLNLSVALSEQAESLEPAEVASMAKAIHRSAHQVAHLTQNLMLVAKLEHLNPQAPAAAAMRQQQTARADRLITSIANNIAADYFRENDLEIVIEPLTVKMSEAKLKKVCEELLDNAFKFSEEGTQVKVFCSRQEESVSLYIIDYGQGMTAEQINQIGAYLQFDTDASDIRGIGLGLTIAKRLVELHLGEIMIESLPGQQTVVRVVLPIQREFPATQTPDDAEEIAAVGSAEH